PGGAWRLPAAAPQPPTGLDSPFLPPGPLIDADDRAIGRGGVDDVRDHGGREIRAALGAERDSPLDGRDRDAVIGRQWAGLLRVLTAAEPGQRRRRQRRRQATR